MVKGLRNRDTYEDQRTGIARDESYIVEPREIRSRQNQ
jgi:hypothetical protein